MNNYCFFRTKNGIYIYDAFCDKFHLVSRNLYNLIKNRDASLTNNIEYRELLEMGFLKNIEIKCIYNNVTPLIPYFLDRQLSTFVLQVTQGCNLRCGYCPYSQDNNLTRKHSFKVMTWDIAKQSIDYLFQHSVDKNYLSLGFYGGEPLLNFNLIKKSVNYVKNIAKGKKINFNITTNLTLVTDEMLEFFDDNSFVLVVSLDGNQEVNDKNRKYFGTHDSVFNKVIQNLKIIYYNYPNLYKNLSLNMVLDPSLPYDDYESLFKDYPFLREIDIHASIVDDSYSDEKNVWCDDFKSKYNYKIVLSYLSILNNYDLFDEIFLFQDYLPTLERTIYSKQAFGVAEDIDGNITPSGMCILGKSKTFVSCDGDFYPCEKVNETNPEMKIGDVYNGYNLGKVEKLFNFTNNFNKRCIHCIAYRNCEMCLSNFGTCGIEDNNVTRKVCVKNKKEFMNSLVDKATFYEIIKRQGANNETK